MCLTRARHAATVNASRVYQHRELCQPVCHPFLAEGVGNCRFMACFREGRYKQKRARCSTKSARVYWLRGRAAVMGNTRHGCRSMTSSAENRRVSGIPRRACDGLRSSRRNAVLGLLLPLTELPEAFCHVKSEQQVAVSDRLAVQAQEEVRHAVVKLLSRIAPDDHQEIYRRDVPSGPRLAAPSFGWRQVVGRHQAPL